MVLVLSILLVVALIVIGIQSFRLKIAHATAVTQEKLIEYERTNSKEWYQKCKQYADQLAVYQKADYVRRTSANEGTIKVSDHEQVMSIFKKISPKKNSKLGGRKHR